MKSTNTDLMEIKRLRTHFNKTQQLVSIMLNSKYYCLIIAAMATIQITCAVPLPPRAGHSHFTCRLHTDIMRNGESATVRLWTKLRGPCNEGFVPAQLKNSSDEAHASSPGIESQDGGQRSSSSSAQIGLSALSPLGICFGVALATISVAAVVLVSRLYTGSIEKEREIPMDIESGDTVHRFYSRPHLDDLFDDVGFESALKAVASPDRVRFQ